MEDDITTPVARRLQEFIDSTGMSNSQFADKAAIPRPSLSQILHGRNKSINDVLLRKLDDAFPELNLSWLLFGRGDMRVAQNIEISEPQIESKETVSDGHIPDNDILEVRQEEPAPYGNHYANHAIFGEKSSSAPKSVAAAPSDTASRKVSSIIVLYSDGSFESFTPSGC